MSKRQFVSTILLLILLNLVIKAIFIFGIDLQVQQKVGPSAYGLYFMLLNLCYIFQIINDFGLNLLHSTDTAAKGIVMREKWMQILRLKVILASLYTVVVITVASLLGYMDAWKLLGWLILNNILVSLVLLMRAGISGMARYKTEAFISVLDKALMILICGFLFFRFGDFQIEWFVWSQTAALVITAVVAWIVSSGFVSILRSGVLSNLDIRIVLRDAIPFTLMTFLMFVYTRSDTILIEQLHEDKTYAVGVYAAGFRLLDAANMIAFLFGPLLIPMFVRLKEDRTGTLQLMELAAGMMIFMTAIISVGSYFWAWPIMEICYGKNIDLTWVDTFRILLLSHVPVGLMYIFGSYLTAMRALKQLNWLFSGSVVVSLLLNFILIPRLGTIGAATTALVTQGLNTAGLIFLSHVLLKEKMHYSMAVKVVLYFLILIASGWVLTRFYMPWWMGIGLFCAGGIISAFLLGLLQWGSFIELIRKRESAGG